MTLLQKWLLVCVALAALMAGWVACWNVDFRASDDNLWLYMASQKLDHPDVVQAEKNLITSLEKTGYSGEGLARMQMRETYGKNYLASLVLYRVAGFFLKGAESADYAEALTARMVAGFATSFLAVAIIFAMVLFHVKEKRLSLAVLLGIGLCFAGLDGNGFYFILKAGQNIFNFVGTSIINPGPQFSLFGFTPRGQFAILMLAAFLLRWNGAVAKGYGMLLLAMLFHQSHGGFMLAVMVCSDIAWKGLAPFKHRAVQAAIGVMIGLFIWRESLWTYIGWQAFGAIAIVLFVLCAYALVLKNRALPQGVQRLRAWGDKHPVVMDGVTLFGILMVLSAITYSAQFWTSAVQNTYFWGQLPTRFLAMVQPVLMVSFVYAVIGMLGKRQMVLVPLIIALVIWRISIWPWHHEPYAKAIEDIKKFDVQLEVVQPYTEINKAKMNDEPLWYYAIAREFDQKKPSVTRFFTQ